MPSRQVCGFVRVFNDLNDFKVVKDPNPIYFYRQKQTFVML